MLDMLLNEALQLIIDHLNCSEGYAYKLLHKACVDDCEVVWGTSSLRPGLHRSWSDACSISRDDLLDWLNRNFPKAMPPATPVSAQPTETRRGTRGPAKGTVKRYEADDRKLFPEIKRRMKKDSKSPHAVTLDLAEEGEVAGVGTPESRAKRLAGAYIKSLKLTETR